MYASPSHPRWHINTEAHIPKQHTRTLCNIMLSNSREQLSRPLKASALCHYFMVIVLKVKSAGCHSMTQGRTKRWRPHLSYKSRDWVSASYTQLLKKSSTNVEMSWHKISCGSDAGHRWKSFFPLLLKLKISKQTQKIMEARGWTETLADWLTVA